MSKISTKRLKPSSGKIKTNLSDSTLDTIMMAQQTLSKMSEYSSKNALWKALPRQVKYSTLQSALDYLEESHEIMYDKDRTIIWTFANNPKLKRLVNNSKSLLH